jgi:hypothetical protein
MKTKEKWEAERQRYLWHLLETEGKFDRSHWWKEPRWKKELPEQAAALYEIARRHPLVGDAMLRRGRDFNTLSPVVRRLAAIGLKSWPTLNTITKVEVAAAKKKGRPKSWLAGGLREYWLAVAGSLKGIDSRTDEEKCYDLGLDEQERAQLRGDASFDEQAVARAAVNAYRKGYALFAVAPDLVRAEGEVLLMRKYAERLAFNRKLNGKGKSRASNYLEWLDLIEEFEEYATNPKAPKHDPSLFDRYKKVIDSIEFPKFVPELPPQLPGEKAAP